MRLTGTGAAVLALIAASAAFMTAAAIAQRFPHLCPPHPSPTHQTYLPMAYWTYEASRADVIETADVVVVAKVESIEGVGLAHPEWGQPICWGFYPHLRFTLRVSEYLRGDGEGVVEALMDTIMFTNKSMTVRQAAEEAEGMLYLRDGKWDGGESIVFLWRVDGRTYLIGDFPNEYRLPSAGGGRFYAEPPRGATPPPTVSLVELQREIAETKR